MCGISGFTWTDEDVIREMNRVLRHRGPDDDGIYVNEHVSLGADRLAILDLSSAAHQPLEYEHRGRVVYVVHNGEIYNFRQIREELRREGYQFGSDSDTEVLAAAYLEWGMRFVEKLNGMWAFCIYDGSSKTLFLSRDRFGVKPLYYYYDGKNLVFSSEIRGLFVHEIAKRPDDTTIYDFLVFNVTDHGENTFFEGVKRLQGSHNLTFDLLTREITISRYYEIKQSPLKYSEKPGFRRLFEEAVAHHLVSDVPVGTCLSGGIDSSSIICEMRHQVPENRISSFSLVFPGQSIDESRFQHIVVAACKIDSHETTFTPENALKDLDELVVTQEEPFTGLSPYGQFRVMKLASENRFKVLLDGQGGDELLAGYVHFLPYHYVDLLRAGLLMTLFREVWVDYRRRRDLSQAYRFCGLLLPERLRLLVISRRRKYLTRAFLDRNKARTDPRLKRKSLNEALVTALISTSLPALLRLEDKNSMHWSVESRVPFLDRGLSEFCIDLPPELKMSHGTTKVILREELTGLVPADILNRRDKIGFAVPADSAVQGPISQFILDILHSESFKGRPYWDWRLVEQEVRTLSKKPLASASYDEVWRLVILELWFRRWIDNRQLHEPAPASQHKVLA